jgi:predicted NBD/HSP70 family sugar kinase
MVYLRLMQDTAGDVHGARRRRAAGRDAVVGLLGRAAPLSRAEISARTGLSRSTVSAVVQELLADGAVQQVGASEAGRGGRPPSLLTLAGAPGVLIGVDIGHRHVQAAVADLAANVLAERRTEIDVDHSSRGALDAASDLAAACLEDLGISPGSDRVVAVGLGVPGPVDPKTGAISSPILPNWVGTSPAAELAARLGRSVRVDNDANLGALGEAAYGSAQGREDVLFVKSATGIGAGMVLAGRLYRGATGIAGEIGHVRFDDDGPVCRCGNRGCLETAVSAPRLVELLAPAYGAELTVDHMLDLGDAGDAGVNRILDDAGRAVGRVLADLCNHLNPGVIVIGGDLGRSGTFLRGIRDSVDRYAQPDIASALDVVPSKLGARASLMGAFVVAIDETAVVAEPA